MAKFYYGIALVPELPQDIISSCPYVMVLQHKDGGVYVYGSIVKPYVDTSNRLQLSSGRSRATYDAINDVWGDINTSTESTYCALADTWAVLWSSFDIPSGSITSNSVYLYGSEPVDENQPIKKLYYNGELLPEIPQIPANYPYVFIGKGSQYYYLAFSNVPYYVTSSRITASSATVQNYRLSFEDYENDKGWTFRNLTQYYYETSTTTLIWSNYNVPYSSASSSLIYFYSSEPSTTTTWKCFETTGGTSLTGTLDVEAGMWVLATVTTRSATTYPDDWTLLHESTALNSDNLNQRMAFLCKKAESDGVVSITITQSSSARIYINLIGIKGINGFKYYEGSEYYTDTKYSQYQMNRPSYKKIIWGLSTPTWATSSPYGEWTCDELSGKPISLIGDAQRRQANFIDDNPSDTRLFKSSNGGSDYAAIIDYVEVIIPNSYYLIRSNNELYTITNGTLSNVETELNSNAFSTYGFDELGDPSVLLLLTNPELLYWQDLENEPLEINATLTATPCPQSIITENIDLTHHTIAGIVSIVGECEGSPLFACEFNGVWKEFDGTSWVDESSGMSLETLQAITLEQWDEAINGLSEFKIKFILNSADDKVTQLKINFNVDVTQAI